MLTMLNPSQPPITQSLNLQHTFLKFYIIIIEQHYDYISVLDILKHQPH